MELPDIPVLNWFEEPIKESIKSVFDGINSGVEALDVFNKYKKTHFEMLSQQVDHVKILGMQQPMDLRELYYPATVSTTIRRRIYAPEWDPVETPQVRKRSPVPRPLEAGDAYIGKNHRTVVLGGPGAGKTTFLKFIALAYSDKAIYSKTKLTNSYLPIYIHLPVFARENCNLIEWICHNLRERKGKHAQVFYTRLLEKGACILLLDSLDEVPIELRSALIDKVKKFASLYPKVKIVLTCRTADYDQVFEDFTEVELAKLSKTAITSIVKAWFGKDAEKSNKLLALLDNDDSVATLTETPLLLSLLCIQFRNDLALPKKKTELYRRCVDALIRDWDTTRGFRRDSLYSQLSDDSKEKIFEAVAGAACNESIEYELSEPFILDAISKEISRFSIDSSESRSILKEIESHHGILEKCSAQSYEFSHGTMQEYFAARYFVAKRMETAILKKNYENEGWHNIITFAASIMDDPTSLLEFLISKSSLAKFQNYPAFGRRLELLWLLYKCMAMGVSIEPVERKKICEHLVVSQIHMLEQLNKDGVLPYAARLQNGVRQKMYYYEKGRRSLDKILRPYRNLMNEILQSTVKEYSEVVVEKIKNYKFENGKFYGQLGIKTCLLIPISNVKPDFFLEEMKTYAESLHHINKAEHVKSFLDESIKIVQEEHKQ